jgi:hypothetical protein
MQRVPEAGKEAMSVMDVARAADLAVSDATLHPRGTHPHVLEALEIGRQAMWRWRSHRWLDLASRSTHGADELLCYCVITGS